MHASGATLIMGVAGQCGCAVLVLNVSGLPCVTKQQWPPAIIGAGAVGRPRRFGEVAEASRAASCKVGGVPPLLLASLCDMQCVCWFWACVGFGGVAFVWHVSALGVGQLASGE